MNISEPYYEARQSRLRRWAIAVHKRSSVEVMRYETEQAARDARAAIAAKYDEMATASARVKLNLDREREEASV